MNNKDIQTPFTVSPYPLRSSAPWKLEIRASFAGKKIRRFFKTESEAWMQGEEIAGIIKTKGVAALEAEGMTVATAVKKFSVFKKFTGSHGKHMERNLRLFMEMHGKRGLDSICPMDLHRFWDRPEWPEGRATRRQAYAYMRVFFNWCERNDMVSRNPIRRVDPPKTPPPLKNILSPAVVSGLVSSTTNEVRAWICLGAFAGLRSDEIVELKPDDLDWNAGEIHIRGGKTGERYVTMEDAFIRCCPREWTTANTRNWYKRLRASAGPMAQNCLRHSFATYHLARYQDAGKTAHQMGHSDPRMVSSVYALAARRADATAFWGIDHAV